MRNRIITTLLCSVLLLVIFSSGCGPLRPVGRFYDNFTAYYNTFYNVKKKFNEAERVRRKNIREHQNPNTEPSVPINTYQTVIESGASLLEYYPDSRWIDDALILMGISYYRLGELGRAERKFSELITIFPNSEHVSAAYVWRARVVADQGRLDEAEKGLFAALPFVKRKNELAEAYSILARLYEEKKQWNDASSYYEKSVAGLRNRDEQNDAYFALGSSLLNQKKYSEAKEAFYTVINNSRNTRQIFDASILWSRCALALGDYSEAERLLLRLRRNPEFETLVAAIDVEIAALAVATGEIDRGAELYQDFVNKTENSVEKGIAYFRLGEIYRDYKTDLLTAQAKFDSVSGSGAARSLIDSARAASDGLSRGLFDLSRIESLRDSIASFEFEADSLKRIDWSQVPLESEEDDDDHLSELSADSLSFDSINTSETLIIPADTAIVNDSLLTELEADTVEKEQKLSPAALLADSLLRAMKAERDKADADSTIADSVMVELLPVEEDTISIRERRALERIQYLDSAVVVLRQNLMSSYLETAEFFKEILEEPDSSLKYLELAAAEPIQHEDFWKASLQLAARLKESENPDHERIEELYRQALTVESMPRSVRNMIRKELGYELLSLETTKQEQLLMEAEAAFLTGSMEMDSVALLYKNAFQIDSTSAAGLQALFAMQYIYEYRLRDFESARHVTQTIIDIFPDSGFVSSLNDKLKDTTSSSVFSVTDDEIASLRAKAHEVTSAKPDSTGWPPPEELLKGRRYR
ncbi:tetratricopeptide repeat protein [bacterium]|nr:tetratricopeptide repeat protein [bacterium]